MTKADTKSNKSNKSNEVRQLIPAEATDKEMPQDIFDLEISKVFDIEKDNKDALRWMKYFGYKKLGFSTYKAAVLAGFSESYARGQIYQMVKGGKKYQEMQKRFIKTLARTFKENEALLLPDLAEVQAEVVKLLKEKPELALKHPALLRQIKVGTGVLQDEPGPGSTLISIDKAQFLMRDGATKKRDPED